MMQHLYYDTSLLNEEFKPPTPLPSQMTGLGIVDVDYSNLNAKYDAAFPPIAGLGSGSLKSGSMGVLGALGADPSYPWHTYSADTLALQKTTNDALKANGYCPIDEDGKLGAGTCGAIRKMLDVSGQSATISPPAACQSFTDPSRPPCGGGGLQPASPYTVTSGGMGSSTWLIVGGLVAAGAVGLALYMKKRR